MGTIRARYSVYGITDDVKRVGLSTETELSLGGKWRQTVSGGKWRRKIKGASN